MKSTTPRSAGEISFLIVLLISSLFMLWKSVNVGESVGLSSAASIPILATSLMATSAGISLFKALRSTRNFSGPASSEFRKKVVPNVVIATIALIAVYIIGMEYLGFILASYLFLVICSYFLGVRKKWILFIIPAIFLVAIHFVFQIIFSVTLPSGSFWLGFL